MSTHKISKTHVQFNSFIKLHLFLFGTKISNGAMLVYALLRDRYTLSEKNRFRDREGRVCIKYKIKDIVSLLGISENTAIKYLSEIKKAGLIDIKQENSYDRTSNIYIKPPKTDTQAIDMSDKFLKIPTFLFSYDKRLKPNDILTYTLLFDRLHLSIENNWIDNNDNVFFNFENKELQKILKRCKQAVCACLGRLKAANLIQIENNNNIGEKNKFYLLFDFENNYSSPSDNNKQPEPLENTQTSKIIPRDSTRYENCGMQVRFLRYAGMENAACLKSQTNLKQTNLNHPPLQKKNVLEEDFPNLKNLKEKTPLEDYIIEAIISLSNKKPQLEKKLKNLKKADIAKIESQILDRKSNEKILCTEKYVAAVVKNYTDNIFLNIKQNRKNTVSNFEQRTYTEKYMETLITDPTVYIEDNE